MRPTCAAPQTTWHSCGFTTPAARLQRLRRHCTCLAQATSAPTDGTARTRDAELVRAAAPASLSTRKERGPLAEETRSKQSAAATGRVHSDAARQLLSEAHTGKKKAYAERPLARGQVRSEETRRLISERVREAAARRKGLSHSVVADSQPMVAQHAQKPGVSLATDAPRALGRTLSDWTTEQLRRTVRELGFRLSNPAPRKPALFSLLRDALAADTDAEAAKRVAVAVAQAAESSRAMRAARRSVSPVQAQGRPVASQPKKKRADGVVAHPSEVIVQQVQAAPPPQKMPLNATPKKVSVSRKKHVDADGPHYSVADFVAASAAARQLASIFGDDILTPQGAAFLFGEGNAVDGQLVRRFLDMREYFQKHKE